VNAGNSLFDYGLCEKLSGMSSKVGQNHGGPRLCVTALAYEVSAQPTPSVDTEYRIINLNDPLLDKFLWWINAPANNEIPPEFFQKFLL